MSERDLWAKMTADQLKNDDAKTKTLKNWPVEDLVIRLRDNCQCVHCGRDMLESRDITYFLYSYDHLLPVTKFPDLKRKIWNRVLACRGCNSWKGNLDPSRMGIPATEEYRGELIHRAKADIDEKREAAEALFPREIAIITAALKRADAAKAAGA